MKQYAKYMEKSIENPQNSTINKQVSFVIL